MKSLCRGFTPVLADAYIKMKAAGKSLEIVFVSSDQDEASFKEYFQSMPWLALPLQERALKDTLSSKYGVQGIDDMCVQIHVHENQGIDDMCETRVYMICV